MTRVRPAVVLVFRGAFLLGAFVCPATLAGGGPTQQAALTAQPTPGPPFKTLEATLREAFRLVDRDEHESANTLFERALAQAREAHDALGEAEARRGLGIVLYQRANYLSARAELEQALALYESISNRAGAALTIWQLARVAHMTGQRDRARDLYLCALAEAQSLGERREEASILLGLTMLSDSEPARAQEFRERGLAIAAELGDEKLEGRFLHQWADILFFANDDYASAETLLDRAARLFEKVGARSDLARALTSLGRVQRAHGHPDRALECYRRALEILEQIGDAQGVIQCINAIAVSHSLLGQARESIENYQRALDLARRTGSPRLIIFQLGNLGGGYLKAGDNVRAIEILEKVTEEERDPSLSALRADQLSQAYFNLGRYELALVTLERSRKLLGGAEPMSRMHTSYEKARIERKMGRTSEAIADAREALRTLEEVRARVVPTDFMKRGFGDAYNELFDFSIALMYEAGRHEEAFEVAEEGRGRAFLDLLAGRDVRLNAAAQSALASAHEIEGTLRANGVDPATVLGSTTFDLPSRGGDAQLATLWMQWRKTEPQIRSLVTAAPFSSRDAAAAAARLRSTILSYWVGPTATLIWVIGADGSFRSASVAVPASRITALVQATSADQNVKSAAASVAARAERTTSRAIRARGGDLVALGDAPRDGWRELYKLLIRPIRDALPADGQLLTIEPHGPLFRLSFAALLDDEGKYLIERFPMHYTPAAGVLRFTAGNQRVDASAKYLFVADPVPPAALEDGKSLPPLPGARLEVQAVARLFPPAAVAVLAGADATEDRFRALSLNRTVVHFATHGLIRDDRPLDSFLALAASESTDGRLTAQKIYGLDLQADLVVLSACRSGLGAITGDGIVGLARAFFYAGTSSVIATLWDVADEPSERLVPQFYRSLLRAHDKSRALRAAQLRLLRDLRAGRVVVTTPDGPLVLPEHPMLWAAYILVGEP